MSRLKTRLSYFSQGLLLLISNLSFIRKQDLPDGLPRLTVATDSLEARMQLSLFDKALPEAKWQYLIKAERIYKTKRIPGADFQILLAKANFYAANYLAAGADSLYRLAKTQDITTQQAADIDYRRALLLVDSLPLQGRALLHSALGNYARGINLAQSGWCYVNIARLDLRNGQHSSAENLIIKKSLGLFRAAGNIPGRLACFEVLGDTYLSWRLLPQAKWFYIQQKMLAEEIGNKPAYIASLCGLANTKVALLAFDQARPDLEEALKFARKTGDFKSLIQANVSFANYYKRQGNDKQALAYSSAADRYRNLLVSEYHARQTRGMQALKEYHELIKPLPATLPSSNVKKMPTQSSQLAWTITAFILVLALIIFLLIYRNGRTGKSAKSKRYPSDS